MFCDTAFPTLKNINMQILLEGCDLAHSFSVLKLMSECIIVRTLSGCRFRECSDTDEKEVFLPLDGKVSGLEDSGGRVLRNFSAGFPLPA